MSNNIVNEKITSPNVILISESGENLGKKNKFDSIQLARKSSLDLVQVGIDASTQLPICKICDYGKMKYHKSKSQKGNKHHAKVLKEIKISYTIDQHDLDIKVKKIIELLSHGHKVNYIMELKGLEKKHVNDGVLRIEKSLELIRPLSTINVQKINFESKVINLIYCIAPVSKQ